MKRDRCGADETIRERLEYRLYSQLPVLARRNRPSNAHQGQKESRPGSWSFQKAADK